MAQQNINIGSSANKGDGDPIRTAFTKVNTNFTELYNALGSKVKSYQISEAHTTIDITNLASGNYYYLLHGNGAMIGKGPITIK